VCSSVCQFQCKLQFQWHNVVYVEFDKCFEHFQIFTVFIFRCHNCHKLLSLLSKGMTHTTLTTHLALFIIVYWCSVSFEIPFCKHIAFHRCFCNVLMFSSIRIRWYLCVLLCRMNSTSICSMLHGTHLCNLAFQYTLTVTLFYFDFVKFLC
jgi:hypothetical protein